jgi:nucleoside-diphosphate-sugar epimerase
MDKDKIQEIADELAESMYGKDFYDLSGRQQSEIYNKAIVELDDMMNARAEMMRKDKADGGRIKLEEGGYLDYLRAIKELGFQPIRIDDYKSLQGTLDMKDIIKLTERINMVNKKVE